MAFRCNRRRFVAAAAGLTVPGWLTGALGAAEDSPALSSGATVVDTHTHFYDPTRKEGVPWPPPGDKLLYRRVLPEAYRALPVPTPVRGTVVVEASPWVEDNQWVLDLAAKHPFILGLVGNLPVGSKAFAGYVKRFAANPLFRGIRIRDRKLDGLLEDPACVSDLKLLAGCNLSLDLVGGREILTFADRLSRLVPDLRIVIDHLAGLRVDGREPAADWLQAMRALRPNRNIYFKVSGLVEGTGRSDGSAPADVEFYRPALHAMRELFGPERLLYASNWPVSERFAPLGTVQRIVQDYFRSHSAAEEQQVLWKTGKGVYNWPQRRNL